jgi:heme exporter protein CcmD
VINGGASSGGFWSMGGYARYVWPCIGFACTVLAWNLWSARRYLAEARSRALRALAMAASDLPGSDRQ